MLQSFGGSGELCQTACTTLWLNLCEHVWYELDAPQLIKLITRMNDLLSGEERRKQKLLLSLPRKP
jgi:hypothetical protein